MPIETAPKDGSEVLLYRPLARAEILQARWRQSNWGRWEWGGDYWGLGDASVQPTHWMPLPPPPGIAASPEVPNA
jgi:hypothetical protein